MNSFRQFVMTAVRVVMFATSVIVLLAAVRSVLSHPTTRAALGISLLFLTVGAILTAAAWALRRMWTVSGQLASVIVPASSQVPKEERA
jgi:long-subunit fatty acid transport protein